MGLILDRQFISKIKNEKTRKNLLNQLKDLGPKVTRFPGIKDSEKQPSKPELGGIGQTKSQKFGNKWTIIDDIKFQSKKEANRYFELKHTIGLDNFKRQVKFSLDVNDIHIANYYADFTYYETGELIVEDVKSAYTRKLRVYQIKKKLMLAIHGISIKET